MTSQILKERIPITLKSVQVSSVDDRSITFKFLKELQDYEMLNEVSEKVYANFGLTPFENFCYPLATAKEGFKYAKLTMYNCKFCKIINESEDTLKTKFNDLAVGSFVNIHFVITGIFKGKHATNITTNLKYIQVLDNIQ